ncbi:MAG: G1 family endopeptidase [Chloroflexi bacterium]|nr:G1 family endopeptidase [Chloroflexota bacterium]
MRRKIASLVLAVFLVVSLLIPSVAWASGPNEKIDNGIMPEVRNDLPQPPADFNPLTATAQELQKYGLPAKPTDEEGAKQWEDVYEHCKHYVKPEQIPSTSTYTHGLVGTYSTTNWAGYVVRSCDNKINGTAPKYTIVYANWYQPTYNGPATASFWVGMDGFVLQGGGTSGDVVQAGCDSMANLLGGPSQYCFWVENAPHAPIWQAAPVVHGGDRLGVQIQWVNNHGLATLSNVTTGVWTVVSFDAPHYDGTSAEFIYESGWGQPRQYAQFGSVSLQSCSLSYMYAGHQYDAFMYDSNYSKVNMVYQGIQKAHPSAPSGSPYYDFTIYSN